MNRPSLPGGPGLISNPHGASFMPPLEFEFKRRGTFPILKLAGELRNKIYRYALVMEEPCLVSLRHPVRPAGPIPQLSPRFQPGLPLTTHRGYQIQDSTAYSPGLFPSVPPARVNIALLRVSHQIYEEASSILYAENEVAVDIYVSNPHDQSQRKKSSELSTSLVVPKPYNFGRFAKLQIHFNATHCMSPIPSEKLRQDMNALFRAAIRTLTLKTVQIILYFGDVYPPSSMPEWISSKLLTIKDVFSQLSLLTQVEMFEIVTGRFLPETALEVLQQWISREIPTTSKIEFRETAPYDRRSKPRSIRVLRLRLMS
ncbi:MAG: hypothetical protein M1812_005873 [Candelaria pacifica]|nr:MAG: hypothetical protein M1812_005873 [Candelaria pacifica]